MAEEPSEGSVAVGYLGLRDTSAPDLLPQPLYVPLVRGDPAPYSALGTSGAYPLPVTTMIAGTAYAGELTAGGSTHFRFAVPATATATLTVTSGSATTPGLRLLVIRTK